MASQETPNYRLSRWAGTDRILVEEFNDNWDKIDAALTAIGQYEILDEVTLETGGNSHVFDLTGFDWSKWQFVGVSVQASMNQTAQNQAYVTTLMGAPTDCTYRAGSFSYCATYAFMAVAAPLRNAESAVKGFYVGYTSGIAYGTTPFSKVTGWALNATTPYPAGTKMVLWGIK